MIYKVQDPSGQVHEIEGPDGASPEEVLHQAQSIIPQAPPKEEGLQEMAGASANPDMDPREGMKEYPGHMYTDPSVADYQTVTGIGGLAKMVPGIAAGVTKSVLPNAARYLEQGSANNVLKSLGASQGQIRQLGPEVAQEAGKFGLQHGMADITQGSIGRKDALEALAKSTGENIGSARQAAGNSSGDIASQIEKILREKYASGVHSGETASLEKALEEIRKLGPNPSHADLAQVSTNLNKYAETAKMTQPVNATTDVANHLSRLNNEGIVQGLGADKGKQYLDNLSDFPKIKQLEAFNLRGEAKEAVGKGGIGNIVHSVMQPIKDSIGYKAMAKIEDAGAQALNGAPSVGEIAKKALMPGIKTVGGITANLMNAITTNPHALGKYAAPLMKAAQEGGSQGLAATHYILSTTHPEYNQLMSDQAE